MLRHPHRIALRAVLAATATLFIGSAGADEVLLSEMRAPAPSAAVAPGLQTKRVVAKKPAPALQRTNARRAKSGAARARKRIARHAAPNTVIAPDEFRVLQSSRTVQYPVTLPTAPAATVPSGTIARVAPSSSFTPASGAFVRAPSSSGRSTRLSNPMLAQNDLVPIGGTGSSSTSAPVTRTKNPSKQNRPMNPAGALEAPVAAAPAAKSPKIPNLILGINNYYDGSTVKDFTAGYQPDKDTGYDGSSVELVTHFYLGYKLTDNLALSVNPQFSTTSNVRTYDAATNTYGAQDGNFMKPVLPFLRLNVGSFIETHKDDKFSWGGDFRYYAPITESMQGRPDPLTGEYKDQQHLLRTGQNVAWKLDGNWGFNVQNIFRYSIRPAAFQNGKRALKLEIVPAVTYTVNDSLTAVLAYEMFTENKYGESFTKFGNSSTYFEPAIDWATKYGFEAVPFVRVYTGNHANLDTTAWGAYLLWSIL